MDTLSIQLSAMDKLNTFSDLISLWPDRTSFAADLGVQVGSVHKWAKDRPIPSKFFAPILRAAQDRQLAVSAADLVRLADAAHGRPREDAA